MYFHVELFFLDLTLSVANVLNFAEDNISKNNVEILTKEQSKKQLRINIIELVDIST
jgi:hypothetical protein